MGLNKFEGKFCKDALPTYIFGTHNGNLL